MTGTYEKSQQKAQSLSLRFRTTEDRTLGACSGCGGPWRPLRALVNSTPRQCGFPSGNRLALNSVPALVISYNDKDKSCLESADHARTSAPRCLRQSGGC